MVSPLTDLLFAPSLPFTLAERGFRPPFGGGGGDGCSVGNAPSYSPLLLPSTLLKNLADVIRGRAAYFLGLVSVEFPISVNTPLPLLFPMLRVARLPEGDWFSASEDCGWPPLMLDQVLELRDLGVTFLPGTAGPRKPALRSCMRRAWRLVPFPERGLVGSGSSCHISEPSLAICLDAIDGVCNPSVILQWCKAVDSKTRLSQTFMEVDDACTMVNKVLSREGVMLLLSAACNAQWWGHDRVGTACSDVLELFTLRSPPSNGGRLPPAGARHNWSREPRHVNTKVCTLIIFCTIMAIYSTEH